MLIRGVVSTASSVRTFSSLSSLSTGDSPSSSGRAARALEVIFTLFIHWNWKDKGSFKMYMRGVKEHDKMMGREGANFERGKRHLANMMGMEASTMTQNDIDTYVK